jgi:ketosteroid isomerase-like protein
MPPFPRFIVPVLRWASGVSAPVVSTRLLLILVPALAYAQTADDQRSAREIETLFVEFNAAWERRDAAFIDRYYAHDSGGMFFFERRQLKGWPRVDTLYQNMFANAARGRVRSRYEVLDVGARGNVGWLAATFRLEVIEASGDTTVDEGRQSLVFERREGRWVVVHRHTSFQAPPGPQRRVPLHVTPGPLWSPADDTTGGPDAREIRRRRESSNAAIAQHDTAGIAAILAPNVVVVSSNSVQTAGRDANVKRFAEQFLARPDVVYRRTPDEVRVFAPWRMASEHGRWTGSWSEGDGKLTIGGTYFAKWRAVNGQWLVESETYVPERCSGAEYCRAIP